MNDRKRHVENTRKYSETQRTRSAYSSVQAQVNTTKKPADVYDEEERSTVSQ